MEIDKSSVLAGEQPTPEQVIDRMIDRLATWIKIAPVQYPKEWADLQVMVEEGRARRARAKKRKERRAKESAFRKNS